MYFAHVIYHTLNYIKPSQFYEDITISKGLSSNEMLRFLLRPVEENLETVPEKVTQNEQPLNLIEDPLHTHKTTSIVYKGV